MIGESLTDTDNNTELPVGECEVVLDYLRMEGIDPENPTAHLK